MKNVEKIYQYMQYVPSRKKEVSRQPGYTLLVQVIFLLYVLLYILQIFFDWLEYRLKILSQQQRVQEHRFNVTLPQIT